MAGAVVAIFGDLPNLAVVRILAVDLEWIPVAGLKAAPGGDLGEVLTGLVAENFHRTEILAVVGGVSSLRDLECDHPAADPLPGGERRRR